MVCDIVIVCKSRDHVCIGWFELMLGDGRTAPVMRQLVEMAI